MLEQRFVESFFDVIVPTLHKQNTESVQLSANIGQMTS